METKANALSAPQASGRLLLRVVVVSVLMTVLMTVLYAGAAWAETFTVTASQ